MQNIPQEWFKYETERLAPNGLPVRFKVSTEKEIERLAFMNGLPLAAVVRLLVENSLRQLKQNSAA